MVEAKRLSRQSICPITSEPQQHSASSPSTLVRVYALASSQTRNAARARAGRTKCRFEVFIRSSSARPQKRAKAMQVRYAHTRAGPRHTHRSSYSSTCQAVRIAPALHTALMITLSSLGASDPPALSGQHRQGEVCSCCAKDSWSQPLRPKDTLSARLLVPSGRQHASSLMSGATSIEAAGFARTIRSDCIFRLGLLSGQPGSRYAEVLGTAVL